MSLSVRKKIIKDLFMNFGYWL